MHRLDNPHKLMAQDTLKSHVTTHNLQVGVADACQQDTYQGFTLNRFRLRIVIIECKAALAVEQCAHEVSSHFLFRESDFSCSVYHFALKVDSTPVILSAAKNL